MKQSLNQTQTHLVTRGISIALLLFSVALSVRADDDTTSVLPSPLCDSVQVQAGNELKFHVYATGVQIYHWNGTSWVFIEPVANLYADAGYHAHVGMHYLTPGQGPTWETKSGSKVIGQRVAACTPDSTAIPWLKLAAIFSQGPGVLDGVTFVQRLNTVGGVAPSNPGTAVGEEADVPYTAEYFFYTATD
jgi:hypothetical protein